MPRQTAQDRRQLEERRRDHERAALALADALREPRDGDGLVRAYYFAVIVAACTELERQNASGAWALLDGAKMHNPPPPWVQKSGTGVMQRLSDAHDALLRGVPTRA